MIVYSKYDFLNKNYFLKWQLIATSMLWGHLV